MAVPDTAAHRDFDAFAAEVMTSLLRTAYLMAGDLPEAEDAVQEALFRIARRWPRVRKMERPLAYARRTLVNVMIDSAAHRSRRRAELAEWARGDRSAGPGDSAAERAFQQVDNRFDVAAALAVLPPRQRAVIVLRYWADMTEPEVATALGCSVGTVKSTASRALARLREAAQGPRAADAEDTSADTASALLLPHPYCPRYTRIAAVAPARGSSS